MYSLPKKPAELA